MRLTRVTIAGADDGTPVAELERLSESFPFVEWGILIGSRPGPQPRYPSVGWMCDLAQSQFKRRSNLNLSLHVCGRWLRDLLVGVSSFQSHYPGIWDAFQRVQLNFHGEPAQPTDRFWQRLAEAGKTVIFQLDGANERLFLQAQDFLSCLGPRGAVGLFDLSGGRGVVPESWPGPALYGRPQGYAGGIGPDNIDRELRRIGEVAGDTETWVDMETGVRTANGNRLDLDKVAACLQAAWPMIATGYEAPNLLDWPTRSEPPC